MAADRKTLCRNLVGFACKRPPWVIFTVFLGTLAMGFFALGYFIQHSSIVDTEASKGWNSLYSNLTSLAFCLNRTAEVELEDSISFEDYDQEFDIVNISLPFILTVRPYPGSLSLNASELVGTVPNTYFKFGRNFLRTSKFWISLDSSYLFGHCILDEDEENTRCREMTYPTCMTISLPSAFLPLMRPRSCNYTSNSSFPATITVAGKKEAKESICDGQIELSLSKERTYDSEVLLSLAEKTHLNLELQLASYFLFVIFLSFILFAAIRGRPIKHTKKIIT